MLAGIPYVSLPTLDLGIPIQPFGVIVAIGVLIGAEVMRRYALRHGAEEDDLRGLTAWVVITGFVGAHVFDILAYEQDRWLGTPDKPGDPLLIIKLWDGISSYGGFLGGAMGYAFYMWWKRLTPGMWADATVAGLLLGFSIGRIGCTLVHDHVGSATDSVLGVDYPRDVLFKKGLLHEIAPNATGTHVRAHNMAMYELAYLIPVNALVLWLAFQRKRRLNAGFITVLTGLLYAPVRFFLEFYRPNESDQRWAGLTFAQWASIAAFLVAAYVAVRIWKTGKPALLAEELGDRPGGRRSTLEALARAKVVGKPLTRAEKKEKAAETKEKAEDKKAVDAVIAKTDEPALDGDDEAIAALAAKAAAVAEENARTEAAKEAARGERKTRKKK